MAGDSARGRPTAVLYSRADRCARLRAVSPLESGRHAGYGLMGSMRCTSHPGRLSLARRFGRSRLFAPAWAAAAREDAFPVEWIGHQAVVSLPEHIDVSNAGQIREELLSVINRGAAVLIAGMTATGSRGH